MATQDAPRLTGQAALVTGASSGLGRATAIALAQAGADVALLARSEDDLRQVAQEIAETTGRRALSLPLDLADEEALLAAADAAATAFGRVDVLVNAAGTDVPGPVEELAIPDWDRVLAVNLRAPFALAKAVFPHMRRTGRGTIVNVSSVAGKRGWANASAYCASKFGLTGLTQALAAEGKPHGIRACVLYPGGMATQRGAWSRDERVVEGREPLPATKALPAGEVAALIVWIAGAPPELVLNEATVSPLEESGWP
ncbi:MAG: SDR family oxidoreductase [Chloroflexota bacterium]|nr:SDR family oxidoreductase [Chloroflexota bacterium]